MQPTISAIEQQIGSAAFDFTLPGIAGPGWGEGPLRWGERSFLEADDRRDRVVEWKNQFFASSLLLPLSGFAGRGLG